MLVFGWRSRRGSVTGIVPTDAMVERFDLLIIIVLGEVVTGVVNGLAGAEQDPLNLATGFVALVVGFGLWWIFFDVGGAGCLARRLGGQPVDEGAPARRGRDRGSRRRDDRPDRARARGADAGGHGLAASGSVALLLVALGVMTRTLADYLRHAVIFRPLGAVMAGAAGWPCSSAGGGRPRWILALLLAAILAAVWVFAVVRLFTTGTWTARSPVAPARVHKGRMGRTRRRSGASFVTAGRLGPTGRRAAPAGRMVVDTPSESMVRRDESPGHSRGHERRFAPCRSRR